VQLPFVQHVFPDASIVPILLGRTSQSNVKALSDALQVVFGDSYERVLFVVSANLTAYLNGQVARKNADTLLELIRGRDWEGILRAESSGAVNSCGAGCIAGILSLDLSLRPSVLSTGDSSEVNGDKENVVHYAAISLDAEELGLHGVQPNGK
jgi:AmmeMemoRadiSam system protein B